MKLGINAYEANVSNRVGSNEYAFQVLIELEKLTREAHDDVEIFLATPPVSDLPKERDGWKYSVVQPLKFWTFVGLPIELFKRKLRGEVFDVFYSLGHYSPRFCPFPSVISIMDLAYERYPSFFKRSDLYKLKRWTEYSLRQAKKIIAISKHTKKDLIGIYKIHEEKITIAYPGFELLEKEVSVEEFEELGIKKPYLLYVGTIQPRKNLIRLLEAFEMIKKQEGRQELSLVIAGKIGWMAEEVLEAVRQSTYKDDIRLLGFVTDAQKAELYKHAETAILVGLYEGFGIPALEAMHYGLIPVVSNTASLPEVVGNAGVIIDPHNSNDISRGINEVLDMNDQQKAMMQQHGKSQIKNFTWQKTGEIIYDVLQKVAKE